MNRANVSLGSRGSVSRDPDGRTCFLDMVWEIERRNSDRYKFVPTQEMTDYAAQAFGYVLHDDDVILDNSWTLHAVEIRTHRSYDGASIRESMTGSITVIATLARKGEVAYLNEGNTKILMDGAL